MARKQRTAAVTAHYTPKMAAAIKSGSATTVGSVLRNATVAAWLVGVKVASAKAGSIAEGVASSGLDLSAPADAPVDWAETMNFASDALPSALAMRLSDLDSYATNILGTSVDPDDQAAATIASSANEAAEDAAQAAYQAGGIDQWNVQLDSADPCQDCEDAEAGGPYDVGDGPDLPIHSRCACESAPVTSEDRSREPLPDYTTEAMARLLRISAR